MKLFVVLLFCSLSLAKGDSILDSTDGWNIPTVDGPFTWVPREDYNLCLNTIIPDDMEINFLLYTSSNPTEPQLIKTNDTTALASSNFNPQYPTRFITHGWMSNCDYGPNSEIGPALLKTGSYNVLCVDWSSIAINPNYIEARCHVAAVGQLLAEFIEFLYEKGGMSFRSLVLYGHSLGAHICGYAGKLVKGGVIGIICGLDPAGPAFDVTDCTTRLCSTDAVHVAIIHTNGDNLGILEPIGTIDYYPNGGKNQPCCGADLTGKCAHARAITYCAEAISKNNFPTFKCDSYTNAVNNVCGFTYSNVLMGSTSSYDAFGYYYVPINCVSPYGYGA